MNAGPAIKEFAVSKGISIKELAEKMDLTPQRVRQLLQQPDMMLGTAQKLCAAIGDCAIAVSKNNFIIINTKQ